MTILENWYPVIYFAVVFIGFIWVYVWWNLLTDEEKADSVWWPLVVFILFWPIVAVFALPLFIIMAVFLGLSHSIMYLIKRGRTPRNSPNGI